MKSTCLLLLAPLVFCYLTACAGQGPPEEDGAERMTIDDIILQRAESLLLRSILRKLQDGEAGVGGSSSQAEWVSKRQHPGKRNSDDLEKRQHPGRREEEEDEEEEEPLLDVQRRQHPGKRDGDAHALAEFQKRQHPGKRATMGHVPENILSELSKRQHPGKRYLLLHSKRQHPGKRRAEDRDQDQGREQDRDQDRDQDWDQDAGADGDEELAELEKRQHPGKRLWDNSSPDLGANSPCDVLDPTSCRKTSLLLELLDNIKSHAEEKRQHPGKRFASEEDAAEAE